MHEGETFFVFSSPIAAREFEALTPSEKQVLADVARGMSNAAIARARQTSARTVANQVASLLRKTGAGSRTELARLASSSGSGS
jgi:DNA-binding NarL/FixJ family response regulator